jgi:hypothetical protein
MLAVCQAPSRANAAGATSVRGGDNSPAPERARNRHESMAIRGYRRDFRHQCLKWSAIIGDPRNDGRPRTCRVFARMELEGLEHPDLLGAIHQLRARNRAEKWKICRPFQVNARQLPSRG